jgi:hypothetical protein
MRKKKEGNEEQKRKAAREARRQGHRPSEVGATSGASKQRHHLPAHDDNIEKIETIRQGKQSVTDVDVSDPTPRPRTRRWHHDHEHDPLKHPHPPDYETHLRKGMP